MCEWTVFLGVLIPALRPEVHYGMHIYVQGFQFLLNLSLGLALALFSTTGARIGPPGEKRYENSQFGPDRGTAGSRIVSKAVLSLGRRHHDVNFRLASYFLVNFARFH